MHLCHLCTQILQSIINKCSHLSLDHNFSKKRTYCQRMFVDWHKILIWISEPETGIFHCIEPRLPLQISRWWNCNRSQLSERTKPIRAATTLAICANSAAHSLCPPTTATVAEFTLAHLHTSHTFFPQSSIIPYKSHCIYHPIPFINTRPSKTRDRISVYN